MLIEAAFAQNDHASVLAETTRFYEVMFSAGREDVAWGIVQSLNARINRLRAITITSNERGTSAPAEMHQLLDALRRRDPQGAQQAAEAHVRQAATIALKALAQEQG
jgi:DNA-binding GntR family transcriptional regulator